MKLISSLLDLLFPPRCMICHRLIEPEEQPVCKDCLNSLPEFDGAAPHVRFAERVCVSFYYEDSFREAFLRFKFAERPQYAEQFGKWMSVTVRDKLQGRLDILTYVPVSKKRLAERGYDQSELLCRTLSKELGIEMKPLLFKHVHTKAQSSLRAREERSANASGAYCAVSPEWIAGRRILLVDDVITTGATMSECCRVLMTAGAKSVCAAGWRRPVNHKKGEHNEKKHYAFQRYRHRLGHGQRADL